jgi:hypothetical protein
VDVSPRRAPPCHPARQPGCRLRGRARLRAISDVIGLLRNYIHGEALTHELSDEDEPGITDYLMGKLVIGGRDAERLHLAAAHLPGVETAVAQEWPAGVVAVLPARLLEPLISNLYASINELMEALALDPATLEAAAPFAADVWVPVAASPRTSSSGSPAWPSTPSPASCRRR